MPVFGHLCSCHDNQDFVHVTFENEFVTESWSTLEQVLHDLIRQLVQSKSKKILVNLSSLNKTNSAVVTAIVRIWKKIEALGGRTVVLAPSGEARGTFNLAGLSKRLNIVRNGREAMHQLGLSRVARAARRETWLLQWTSPIAAATAMVSASAILLSVCPSDFQPSIVFVMLMSAAIASGGGWLTAARKIGAFRHFSRLVSITGVITAITVIGQWSV